MSRKKSIPGWAGGQRGEQDSMFGQYCVFQGVDCEHRAKEFGFDLKGAGEPA